MAVIVTTPFCGSCGYDFSKQNTNDDYFCDACGADLSNSVGGTSALAPPTSFAATGQSGGVEFTWVTNPAGEATNLAYSIDDGATVVIQDLSPHVVAGTNGQVIVGRVRTVTDGVPGPWSAAEFNVVGP